MRGMQSILVKSMKDSVVRGRLLQLLYERRSEGSIPFGQHEQAVPPPGGINRRDWLRALAQLSEYHLTDWTPLEDQSGMGLLSGFAKINDFGVKVLEAGVASPISISIDKSRRATVPRRQQTSTAPSTILHPSIVSGLRHCNSPRNDLFLARAGSISILSPGKPGTPPCKSGQLEKDLELEVSSVRHAARLIIFEIMRSFFVGSRCSSRSPSGFAMPAFSQSQLRL